MHFCRTGEREREYKSFFRSTCGQRRRQHCLVSQIGGGGNNSSRHLGDKLEQKKARECTSPGSSSCFFLSLKKRLVEGQMFGTPLLPTAEPAVLNGLFPSPKATKKVSALLTRVISMLLLILSLKCSFARRRLILYPRGLSTRGKDAEIWTEKEEKVFLLLHTLKGNGQLLLPRRGCGESRIPKLGLMDARCGCP